MALRRAVEDDAVASTTGATDASATITVCLMESAATTLNLSAPQKTRVRGAVEKASNEAGCVAVTLTA